MLVLSWKNLCATYNFLVTILAIFSKEKSQSRHQIIDELIKKCSFEDNSVCFIIASGLIKVFRKYWTLLSISNFDFSTKEILTPIIVYLNTVDVFFNLYASGRLENFWKRIFCHLSDNLSFIWLLSSSTHLFRRFFKLIMVKLMEYLYFNVKILPITMVSSWLVKIKKNKNRWETVHLISDCDWTIGVIIQKKFLKHLLTKAEGIIQRCGDEQFLLYIPFFASVVFSSFFYSICWYSSGDALGFKCFF